MLDLFFSKFCNEERQFYETKDQKIENTFYFFHMGNRKQK